MNLEVNRNELEMTPAFLYLLVYPDKEMFKVGKAIDIHCRAKTLGKTWGDPCRNESYSVRLPDEETVYKLENALKLLLNDFSMKFKVGPGKTEFFGLDKLGLAIEYINIYCASSPKKK